MNDVIAIRASSWGELMDCAYRWEGKHLLGMRSPAGYAAHLGTAIHRSTAAFDQGRIDGAGLTPDDTAGLLVDALREDADVVRTDDDLTPSQAEKIGITLHTRYCNELSPRFEFVSVESRFEPLDVDIPAEGVTVRLTGQMDRQRVRRATGGLGINDLKTGTRAATKDGAAQTKGRGLQLGVYELLAIHIHGQDITEPAEIMGLATTNSAHIGVSAIQTPRRQILGDGNGPSLMEIAAGFLRRGHFPPNPSSNLCGPKYCQRHRGAGGDCVFHD